MVPLHIAFHYPPRPDITEIVFSKNTLAVSFFLFFFCFVFCFVLLFFFIFLFIYLLFLEGRVGEGVNGNFNHHDPGSILLAVNH